MVAPKAVTGTRGCAPLFSPPRSGANHAAVPQQRIHPRLAAAKRFERLESGPAAAHRQDLVAEALAAAAVERAILLEQAVGVGGKDFGPLVAVVACAVAAGEDVREVVLETV